MSYDQQINNHIIKFKDEASYLNCRLDYLKYCKNCEDSYQGEGHADMLTFYGYIESEMYYDDTCEVESIEPVPTESNSVIFDSFGGMAMNGDNMAIGYYTTHANNLEVMSQIAESVTNTDSNFAVNYNDLTFRADGTWKIDEGKNKKEELPDKSIDNRFDILDL